jgi:S-(hydroxymethyl)glutathione dehydrogenase/alcohol dehydrogenase
MKTQAAVLYEVNQPYVIEELEIDPPKSHEVLVHLKASGVCHSDYHPISGDQYVPLPMIGGHEGAGVVEEVGPGVTHVKPGDHVVMSYIPSCGTCRWCTLGMTNLCDLGEFTLKGPQLDGTYRFHNDRGQDIGQFCMIGTFSEYIIAPSSSVVKIHEGYPLERACLVACGVSTGIGCAIHRAKVQPGSSVLVIGCGGIGSNIIQGARLAGANTIIAADINDFKLEMACEFGATHTVNNGKTDLLEYVKEVTYGVGVDYAFEAIATPETIGLAVSCTSKGGTTVVVGLTPESAESLPIPPYEFVLWQRTLMGAIYGGSRPRVDILQNLDLFRTGRINLDKLVTREYGLGDINQAMTDLLEGRNIRGVIRYW